MNNRGTFTVDSRGDMYPTSDLVSNHRIECKHGLELMKCKGCRRIYLNDGRVPGGKLIDEKPLTKKERDRRLEQSLVNDAIRGR